MKSLSKPDDPKNLKTHQRRLAISIGVSAFIGLVIGLLLIGLITYLGRKYNF